MTDTLTTHRLRELHRAALDRQMAANDAVAQREGTDTAAAIEELLKARAYLATLAEQAKPVAWLSFDEFVQYGRDHDAGEAFGGMPWSFDFHGIHVTHETDTHYLIGSKPWNFRPGDFISVDAVESEPALISILPIIVRDVPEACKVALKVGVQTFHVGPDYCDHRDEGEHHARMLALALNRWATYAHPAPPSALVEALRGLAEKWRGYANAEHVHTTRHQVSRALADELDAILAAQEKGP